MAIHTYKDIPAILKALKVKTYAKRKTNHSERIDYIELAMSFDIETSSFYEGDEKRAIMYVWQMAINDEVIIGRTWKEFDKALESIHKTLKTSISKRAVIYVHNLQYEYNFIKNRFNFVDVFNIQDMRKSRVVKACTDTGIEFRCSYVLTNKKLGKLAKDIKNKNIEKKVGDLDYNKIRHSKTPLTDEEIEYCINDVLIVTAYINQLLEEEHLSTIPMTSTGFVRRTCKRAYRKDWDWKRTMMNLKLTPETYDFNRKVYQGAVVHANIIHSGKVINNVGSWDFDSSYVACMIGERYPVSSPKKVAVNSLKQLHQYLNRYCCIFSMKFEGLRLKENRYISPISESKCYNLQNAKVDNGRVVSADYLITYITNVDFDLYELCFDWDAIAVGEFYIMESNYLPKGYIQICYDLYKKKKALKPFKKNPDVKYDYMLTKSLLNSLYGMCATDIVFSQDVNTAVENYNKGYSFLYPMWSTFITAYSRRNLFSGINSTKEDFIYCDTDSIKVQNPEKYFDYIQRYNSWIDERIQKACLYHGLNFDDIKGIGRWEFEGIYDRFKTLRAKTYLSEQNGEYDLTVSGIVDKNKVIEYMNKDNNIFEVFSDGLKIESEITGKKTHTYCDYKIEGEIKDYTGKKCKYEELSFVHLEDCPFSINISDEYKMFIELIESRGIRIIEE